MLELREKIRVAALSRGFSAAGFAPAVRLPHEAEFHAWLEAGHSGEMTFMNTNRKGRANPRSLLNSAQSVLVVAADYAHREQLPTAPDEGKIARYAQGPDYHPVMHSALKQIVERIRELTKIPFESFIAVDTAPILERELAMAAGLGFIGKNNMLITPGIGSYSLLGVVLLSLAIPPDPPGRAKCGSCTICLDQCPTNAFEGPYSLNARRCIAYLSIEYRGEISAELGNRMHPWVFGCDVCQNVCPYNKGTRARPITESSSSATNRARPLLDETELAHPPPKSTRLADWISLKAGSYRRLVKGRALSRSPSYALSRNASLASIGAARPNSEIDAALADAANHARLPAQSAARTAIRLRAKTRGSK